MLQSLPVSVQVSMTSVEAACRKMIHTDPEKECHPDAAATKEYDKFHQLYKKLYDDLKDDYQTLATL